MIVRQTFKVGSYTPGGQTPVNVDWCKIPFQASVNVDIVSGSANYYIEYTTDDTTGVNLRWSQLKGPLTASQLSTITDIVTAIRINFVSLTGETRFSVLQGTGI